MQFLQDLEADDLLLIFNDKLLAPDRSAERGGGTPTTALLHTQRWKGVFLYGLFLIFATFKNVESCIHALFTIFLQSVKLVICCFSYAYM